MIVIRGAEVYNPSRGNVAQLRDLWIDGERIIDPPPAPTDVQEIDGRGKVIAPAGVEIHTHVAGYPLNAARRFMLIEGSEPHTLIPSPDEAASLYLQMGYTTIFDAASSPLFARATIKDLDHLSGVDRGTYTLMGDHSLLMENLVKNDLSAVRDILAWLIHVSGGYAVKLVNPGGGLAWKAGMQAPDLDSPLGLGSLTQREIIRTVVKIVNDLGMPHPVHLHACKLGEPGNFSSFCETIKALEGQRAHLCHIQFFCYGQDDSGGFTSQAEQVAQTLDAFPQITCDVGQIMFGSAMAVSADTSALSLLHQHSKQPWISRQVECEGGNNILPLQYKAKDLTSSVQWATGLELLLRFPDPTRMFLTTDHPNGAPFTAYPQIIAWLMNSSARQEILKQMHPKIRERLGLADIEREYSLGEIFAMTSYGPAKALGLQDRGHLDPGALADIRCYTKRDDIKAMFEKPAWVMRRGEIVIENGKQIKQQSGNTLITRPAWDETRLPYIKAELADHLSFPVDQYALGDSSIPDVLEVPCTSTTS